MTESRLVLYLFGTIGLYLLVIMGLLRAQSIVVQWGVYRGTEGKAVYEPSMLKSMLFFMALAMSWLGGVFVILLTRLALIVLKP